MENESNNRMNQDDDQIDLLEIMIWIWKGRRIIISTTLSFFLIGIIVALLSANQYKSEAHLLPEFQDVPSGASSLLRQFGGLGGFSLPAGAGSDAIGPELYPRVLQSTPFFLELLAHEIEVEIQGNQQTMSVYSYMEDHMGNNFISLVLKYTIQLPWTILDLFRPNEETAKFISPVTSDIPKLNRDQHDLIEGLSTRIVANADTRSGVITVSAEFPEPLVAAQIADFAVEYLTHYITEYRLEKVSRDLEFITKRHSEKEEEFHSARLALARFRDANINIVSAAARTEEQRLQDQNNLAFNIYNELALELEQARIKVQEETPVIKILEPVMVPVEKSGPSRSIIVFMLTLVGGILSLGYLYARQIWVDRIGPELEKNRDKM